MNLIGSRSVWLLLLVVACSDVATGQTADPSADLVTATNRFGFALLPELAGQRRDENIFYSPFSMTLALSMAYNGAGGSTARAMHQALGLETLNLEQLNQASATLLEELSHEEAGLRLTIANSLWARQGVTFNPDFLSRGQKFYKAEVSVLNFRDPGSVATINDWVSRNTNGKIPAAVGELGPNDALVLINTVYFKGAWTYAFAPSETREDVFYLPRGAQRQVPMMMMKGTESLRCYSGDEGDAVILPYGLLRAQMELFLPAAGVSITEFVQKFDYEAYLQWQRLFRSGSLTLELPRVSLKYSTSLMPSLQKLGMGIALTGAADFGRMAPSEKLQISKVSHMATLELDEKGTEAAAATVIGGGVSGWAVPPLPCAFIANRPFVVVITDRRHGVILFMGIVTNPKPGAN